MTLPDTNHSRVATRSRNQSARAVGPMSAANVFAGRGRDARARRRTHVQPDRDGFLRRWSLLLIASFDSREACAVHFRVTFQTACNWFDGLNAPYGHHVDFAAATLPRYGEIMRGAD